MPETPRTDKRCCIICGTNHREVQNHPYQEEWPPEPSAGYLPCGHDVSELVNDICIACSELHQ